MLSRILLILALLFPQPESYQVGQKIPNIVVGSIGSRTFFYSEPLDDDTFARMDGLSFNADCPVQRNDLRYVRVLYRNAESIAVVGELVCNKAVSEDLLYIFYELYRSGYKMESVRLVDCFGADDLASMKANNTSCFNTRKVDGFSALSRHSWGMAVDINPLYNPCINRKGIVTPAEGKKYADRSVSSPYRIAHDDLCVRLFRERGWTWGGGWASMKDYQHFEKKI